MDRNLFDCEAKMDVVEAFEYRGWHFLCSGEKMPSGLFHAAVRYKVEPKGVIQSLVLDHEKFDSARPAREHAKELAIKWADERSGGGLALPRQNTRLQ